MTNTNSNTSVPGVDYYNKEITKYNKEITKYYESEISFPLGLASLSSSPLGSDAVAQVVGLSSSQGGEKEDLSSQETLAKSITEKDIKRAIIQLWQNPNTQREWKLKIRLNLDFGSGEEVADFICPLNKDWRNFIKYHPVESKDEMISWARQHRGDIVDALGVKPYLGKFHENHGWSKNGQKFNTKEPYCASIVWYNPDSKMWYAMIKIYDWSLVTPLTREGLNSKQEKCRGQKIWMNPLYYSIQRPKTWAERRFGK